MKLLKPISLVLALVLLLSMIPLHAAADTGASGIKVREGETLQELAAGQYAENYGTIVTNNGTVTENHGTVTTNNGTVTKNYSTGIVTNNNGTVNENNGSVENNNAEAKIVKNGASGSVTYNKHKSQISENAGYIYGNDGTVSDNDGTIDFNRNSVVKNDSTGTINTNRGTVSTNIGTIKTNDNYYGNEVVDMNNGTIELNKSTVLKNYKKVITNAVGGVVKNYLAANNSSIVTTNSGEVYNFGGTVGSSTSTGTEYFEVDIAKPLPVHTFVSTTGLKTAYNTQWVGEVAGVQATATITLAPEEGYEIIEITGLPDNVTARKSTSGIWTLTVTSGKATSLIIPEATKTPPTVSVEYGTGGGKYAEGASVTITAVEPSYDKRFREWTGTDDLTFTSGSATTATATFIMPDHDVTVAAAFDTVYTLTVQNGTGTGRYEAGESVTITANDPPEGKRFKEWSGLNDSWIISGSKTTLTVAFSMPSYNDTVAATYEDIPESSHTVTVNNGILSNGSSSGVYGVGESVTITAGAPPYPDKAFKEWTGTEGLTFTSGSATTATATFIMPDHDVTATATYDKGYTMEVVNGSGSGLYVAGAAVTATANNPPEGKRFKEWVGLSNSWIISGSKTTPTVTFRMPAQNHYIEAKYEDIPPTNTVTVYNGTGSGSYMQGASVTITAVGPDEGKQFKEWIGAEGLTFTFGSATTATATFIMPAQAVTVTATYEDIPITLYPLSGEYVLFFDENFNRITEAAQGQTVFVDTDTDAFPEGYYFSGVYETESEVAITVEESGAGIFTMIDEAVTVDAVLAEQEDYVLLLADGEPVVLPENMSWMIGGEWDDTLEATVLDLNNDDEPDVLLDTDANTAVRLPGADAITDSVTVMIDYPVPYRYKSVCFSFGNGILIGDANLDGEVDIRDVTAIQRHLAGFKILTGEALVNADTNGDGVVTIEDATHLQMYFAEFDVVLGKQTA